MDLLGLSAIDLLDRSAMDLLDATQDGNIQAMRTILEDGTDPRVEVGVWASALQPAAWWERVDIVKLLLDRGVDVNAHGGQYGTALQAAAAANGGSGEIVKMLLDRGADVNAHGGQYGTALQAAAYKGNKEKLKVLLDGGADVNARGGEYGTALQAAAAANGGSEEIVKILLDRGADVNAHGGKHGTALHATLAYWRLEPSQIPSPRDTSAMEHLAMGNLTVRLVRELIGNGVDVKAVDKDGRTTLYNVVQADLQDVIRVLLSQGTDMKDIDKDVEDNQSLLERQGASGLVHETGSAEISDPLLYSTPSRRVFGTSGITYYNGINGGLCLLASTIPRRAWPRNPIDRAYTSKKHFFPLGIHPIVDIWETKILPLIVPLNTRGTWLSVHCLRIGFETEPWENPIILILVKLSSVSPVGAAGLARTVKYICEGFELDDIEVEVAEMPMMQRRLRPQVKSNVLAGPFDSRPYIGASIGPCHPSDDSDSIFHIDQCPSSTDLDGALWSGTFAGYLSATEKTEAGYPILLALTNDHVCFDVDEMDIDGKKIPAGRPCLEPNLIKGAFKSKGAEREYLMTTPGIPGYTATAEALAVDLKRAKAKYEKQKNLSTQGLNHPTTVRAKGKLDLATDALSNFHQATKTLGTVYGTGGHRVDVKSQMSMDWGVIKVLDADPIHGCHDLLNEANLQDPVHTERAIEDSTIRHLMRTNPAFDELLDETDLDSLPTHISEMRSTPPETDEVFFKVGYATGWTAGVPNSCRSVLFEVHNQIVHTVGEKDEHEYGQYGACLTWCFLGIKTDRPFSARGDSGSLVFDRFGRAIGLLFAGRDEKPSKTGIYILLPDISFVVSLEVVLKDIGRQLDLTNIKFANGTEVYC